MLRIAIALLLAFAVSTPLRAEEHPFVLVLVDSASERKLGFPVDRSVMARAIDNLRAAQVRGVALKFFYDQPGKSEVGDRTLATAIGSVKTLLQARIDDAESKPNTLPAKFTASQFAGQLQKSPAGTAGWIPLPLFASAAHDIGFVDIADARRVPVIERYQTRPVKSLTLAALELALCKKAVIESGAKLTLGRHSLKFDADGQIVLNIPPDTKLDYLPFTDLLDGRIDAARLRDKVVVIGYDGSKIHSLKLAGKDIPAHRLFYLGLLDAYRQLK